MYYYNYIGGLSSQFWNIASTTDNKPSPHAQVYNMQMNYKYNMPLYIISSVNYLNNQELLLVITAL